MLRRQQQWRQHLALLRGRSCCAATCLVCLVCLGLRRSRRLTRLVVPSLSILLHDSSKDHQPCICHRTSLAPTVRVHAPLVDVAAAPQVTSVASLHRCRATAWRYAFKQSATGPAQCRRRPWTCRMRGRRRPWWRRRCRRRRWRRGSRCRRRTRRRPPRHGRWPCSDIEKLHFQVLYWPVQRDHQGQNMGRQQQQGERAHRL